MTEGDNVEDESDLKDDDESERATKYVVLISEKGVRLKRKEKLARMKRGETWRISCVNLNFNLYRAVNQLYDLLDEAGAGGFSTVYKAKEKEGDGVSSKKSSKK